MADHAHKARPVVALLAAVKGDPLDDISVVIQRVRWVMKAGEVLVDKAK